VFLGLYHKETPRPHAILDRKSHIFLIVFDKRFPGLTEDSQILQVWF